MLTDARVISALGLRARVTLKRELQRLCRAHSAAAAFLWTATAHGDRSCGIESAGDIRALPSLQCLNGPITTTCEQRTLRCEDREQRETVLLYSRICAYAPVLVIGLIDARAPYCDLLTDDMEAAMERVESLIVEAFDPAPAPQAVRAILSGSEPDRTGVGAHQAVHQEDGATFSSYAAPSGPRRSSTSTPSSLRRMVQPSRLSALVKAIPGINPAHLRIARL